jgi:hypothetical protein
MKFENAGKQRPKTPLLKMVPILIISAMAIMSVAMAASSLMIPPLPSVTMTGIVSDSLCGSDHGIKAPGDPECTRACVELGAQYALMVGKVKAANKKKMYLLHGHEADLEQFAGEEVTVKGRALGRDTITVDQVDRAYSEAIGALN